jgi:aminoglycoside phosphotransferase (APT) family kinase protein
VIPEAALAAVPGCEPGAPPPRVVPLAGGALNRSFRVETRAGVFVLRLNLPAGDARVLGVDRCAEATAQRHAARWGLAPRVIAAAADHAYLVSEYVPGEVATAAQLGAPEGLARLGATLARLRAVPLPPLPRGPTLIERARMLAGQALARVPVAAAAVGASMEAAERGWAEAGQGAVACLVHSDPNPGNVVLVADPGHAVLLDWEYAHVGAPLQDPAAWLHSCPALRGRERQLLRASGLETQADEVMLRGMAAVYAALEHTWSLVVETAAGIPPGRRAN